MPERKREQKPAPKERDSEIADVAAPVETEKAEKLKGDIDDLLDEIDSVLESNAEEFVKSYVQKGGE